MTALRDVEPARAIPVLAVLMEVLWIYPWFAWISEWGVLGWMEPPLTLASALAMAMVAEALSHHSMTRIWAPGRTYMVVLPALAVLLAAVIRLDMGGGHALWDSGWIQYTQGHQSSIYGGLALGTILLWRGITTGRDDPSFDDLYRKFLMGLIALVILLALRSAVSGASEVATSTGFYVLGFFSTGLLTLGLVNLVSIRQEMLRREGSSGVLDQRWFSMLLGVVFVILALSLLTAAAFSFDLAASLLHPLGVLGSWMVTVLIYTVGLPLGLVAAALIFVFRFLASFLGPGESPRSISFASPEEISRAVEGRDTSGIPPDALLVFKLVVGALLAMLVLFILVRALRRHWKGREEEGVEEVSESLWSLEGFKADIWSYLSRLLNRFRRKKPAATAVNPVPVSLSEEWAPNRRFTIREIYQGVLTEGRSVGLPRRRPETPYEYKGRLQSGFPPGGVELQEITEAYAAHRYGRVDTTDEQLGMLNQLWYRLRGVFRGDAREDDTG